ncbi:MAG TPA: LysR family transcriptional regulator [Polyangiaceae bacterium]|nr:LysR family transcriptional regulator [Polyangiaceae bacterium]
MPTLDDLPSLALFARVVQLRSFSAAARETGIAKSAVSRRIAELERALGVRLLQRTTRSVVATDEGLAVYEHSAALLSAASAAFDAAGATDGLVRGTVRVSAPITFAEMHLAPAISAFLGAHPDVSVELATDDRVVDVVEGGFDVAIRIGRLSDSELVARRLAEDRLVVCGAPSYLAARGVPETPEALVNHECLHYRLVSRAAEWRFRGGGGRPLAVPVRGRFEAANGGVLREAAIAGAGLAVLPSFMVAEDVRAGRLELVLEGARRAKIGIFAVTAHRTGAPPRTRAFLDFVARRFARPETIPRL